MAKKPTIFEPIGQGKSFNEVVKKILNTNNQKEDIMMLADNNKEQPFLPYLFEYENEEHEKINVRTFDINGEGWFSVDDLCTSLDIKNSRDVKSKLDEADVGFTDISSGGQKREINIVNESGMYAIVFQSNKPEAKRFKRWITSEVIPSIRKKGYYGKREESLFITHDFARRYNLNWDKTDKGYFSVISELYYLLYGFFEMKGFTIPDKHYNGDIEKNLRPDVSVGKGFSKYFETNFPKEYGKYPKKPYKHMLNEGFTVDCSQYPREVHYIFYEYMQNEWIPNNSVVYLKGKLPDEEYTKVMNILKSLPAPEEKKNIE